MCTLVILFQPDQPWPLILAGNRDEMRDRPSAPPARHWPDQPTVIAGLDRLGGGTWLGMNRQGVVATIMNREGTLGPLAGKKSRGDLVLQALQHPSAEAAQQALRGLATDNYRAFNLFIGDHQHCFWLRNREDQEHDGVDCFRIEPGLHMLASRELDDPGHPRIRYWLPRFRSASPPLPDRQQWHDWITLLGSRSSSQLESPHAAMNMALPGGFGTVSCSLIALPRPASRHEPVWLYADGAPDQTRFIPVSLDW